MEMKNRVFIATSIDGYISDRDGGLDWLHSVPNPDGNDMGYAQLNQEIDAIVMGRNTFETVCDFDIEWPYEHPVFVVSSSLLSIPDKYAKHASLVNGSIEQILSHVNSKGYNRLYIDGGQLIQGFLSAGLIDELCVSTIPVLLGGGASLYGELLESQAFDLIKSEVFLGQIVQNTYRKKV